MDVFDQPKENYLTLSKKCFRYKVPIYFIQQNNFLFSLSPTEGEKMLTGNLGKLGQCYIFFRTLYDREQQSYNADGGAK